MMNRISDVPGRFSRMNHPRLGFGDARNGYGVFETVRGQRLLVLFSDGAGWEHVSVSHAVRVPTWAEMCEVRDLFWPPTDWVMQFHPPHDQYVNLAKNSLHLWRPTVAVMPTPHRSMVG